MSTIAERRPSPVFQRSHGLWSLWDMLTLDAHNFVFLLKALNALEDMLRGRQGPLPGVAKLDVDQSGPKGIGALMRDLDLPVSLNVARHLLAENTTSEGVFRAIDQIRMTLMMELKGRTFYAPLRTFEQYYEQPELFGRDVFDKFAAANTDIFEAGTCLAFERGTACVMHCMRVLEVGLTALAADLGVERQSDWGSYLRKITEELDRRKKVDAFYPEAAAMLDRVRFAWRNPTMHVENEYAPERAEEILKACRALMQHLATRISAPLDASSAGQLP